jgi:predicted metal-dependent HD superfamily phosphohydrolase
MTLTRWNQLIEAVHLLPSQHTQDTFVALTNAYSEPHRYYHNVSHIQDCLDKLDCLRGNAIEPALIEIALWFHDAIYEPLKSANEIKSAAWACQFLKQAGASAQTIEKVNALILVTQHNAPAATPDEALLVDIDLSILGADEARYDQFEKNIRKEYRWVPWFLYRAKRSAILQSFLEREIIYSNAECRENYETPARINLARAIVALKS